MAESSRPQPNIIDLGSDCSISDSHSSISDDQSSDDSSSDIKFQAGEIESSSYVDDFVISLCTTLDWFCRDDVGTFAHSAPIGDEVFKDPQIHIDGIGRIPMPLSIEHAEKIVALSEKGTLKPNAFRFENPLWEQRVLHRLVDEAVKELRIGGKPDAIGAQLREMQLCNKDTGVDVPSMNEALLGAVGTLVVCLPSPHQGGDVHVKLASAEEKLTSSGQRPSFMCWYRDIEPEIKAISSGYRWTLVYDIKNFEQPDIYSSSMLSAQTSKLHANFETWKHPAYDLAPRYVYVLKNDYKNQLSLDALLGGDLNLARTLKGIGQKLGFDIFLATIEKRRHGHVKFVDYDYDDDWASENPDEIHEMKEILEEEISLVSVFDLSGRLLVEDVDIEEEEVLQGHWEDDDAASETDLEDSSDHACATHKFRGTALVMMSHDEAREFLAHERCSTAVMFDHLREQQVDDADDTKAISAFKDFLLRRSADMVLYGDDLGELESIIQACISLKDTELFNSVALPLKKPLSSQGLSDLSSWIWESGFQCFEAGLEKLTPDKAVFETHDFLQALLGRRSSERPQLGPGAESGFFDFVERKTHEVLGKVSQLYLKDVTALVDMLKTTRRFEQTAQKVEEALRRHARNTPVLLHFLNEVSSMSEERHESFMPERFPKIFADMAARFSLRHDTRKLDKAVREQKPKNPPYGYRYPAPEPSLNNSLWTLSPGPRRVPDSDWHLLSSVIARALELNLEDDVAPIIQQLLAECNHPNRGVANHANPCMADREAGRMLLPFMKFLAQKIKGDGLKTLAAFPKIRELYRDFVTIYFNRAVGKEPIFDWSRTPAPSAPGDNRQNHLFITDRRHLNVFLQDPNYIEGRFPLPGYRQKKLINSVPQAAGCTCSMATGSLVVRKGKWAWEAARKRWVEHCKEFVLEVKKLGNVIDLEAVLGETYGNVVLHSEQRAMEEPVVVGDDHHDLVPPHKVYELDGTRPFLGAQMASLMESGDHPYASFYGYPRKGQPGTQRQNLVQPPLAGTNQTPGPLFPTAGNVLPQSSALVARTKRKAGENMVNTDESREAVRRKVDETNVLDLTDD